MVVVRVTPGLFYPHRAVYRTEVTQTKQGTEGSQCPRERFITANKTRCQLASLLSRLIFVIERQIIPVSKSIEKYNNKFSVKPINHLLGEKFQNLFPDLSRKDFTERLLLVFNN